jgi:hypothetical protein
MITLAGNCLLFQLSSGETVPFSPEMISIELMGDTAQLFEADYVEHAAQAVFHYYKHELRREVVTVAEFAQALETVLRGFKLGEAAANAAEAKPKPNPGQEQERSPALQSESDLCRLAREAGDGCELVFFPRLRDEVREQLRQGTTVLRFKGLRSCVKELAGARRWNGRCRSLQDQIVAYLRECLGAEARTRPLSLVVN